MTNEEDAPVTIRAYVLDWHQDGGDDVYAESEAVIVSPPVFTIAPHATQIVRVGLRRPSAAPMPYRLIIEEVPEAAPPGSGIRVALRLNLPLYANLAPGRLTDLEWSAARLADGQWAIEARNKGAGWVRVEAPAAEAATGLRLADGFSFGTVLPGATRRWLVGTEPRIGDRARFQQILRTADNGARRASKQPLGSASSCRCCSATCPLRRTAPRVRAGAAAARRSYRWRCSRPCSTSPSTASRSTSRPNSCAIAPGASTFRLRSCAAGGSACPRSARSITKVRLSIRRRRCRR